MTITFERPIGAHADVKELEYISALHQTAARSLRTDGSIRAEDIVHFLSSRHGIKVDEEAINNDVLVELAGDFQEVPNHILDLCQVMALLLIPHLVQVAASGDDEKIHALFGKVLEAIVTDIGKGDETLSLNRDLMRRILDSYGEFDVPDDLIDEMLVATGAHANGNVTMDVPTFVHVLTGDVTKYGTNWDSTISTHYQDVFEQVDDTNVSAVKIEESDEESSSSIKKDGTRTVKTVFTAASVDTTADTFRSQFFMVILWVALVITYICYVINSDLGFSKVNCDHLSSFGCQVVNGITTWLVIFLQLSVLGSAFIILCSAGNSLRQHKFTAMNGLAIGMIIIFITTIAPFFITASTHVFNTEKVDFLEPAYIASLVLGSVLFALQLLQLLSVIFGTNTLKKYKCLELFLTPGILKMERKTKKAATHKVSQMVENALVLHAPTASASNRSRLRASHGFALMNFQLQDGLTEEVGGFLWGWGKIRDGTIFTEEGVWMHSRIIACVMAQLFVCIFLVRFSALGVKTLKAKFATEPQDGTVVEIPVEGWEIDVGGTVGIVTGVVACLSIALAYIPSFISTVLKFRSGVIPSLRDADFLIYRFSVDQTTIIFGSAFWGCVYTGFFATILVGAIAFLAVWNASREIVLYILAQVIGFAVTVLIKGIILLLLQRQFYAAFYRKRVAEANYTNVVLECWNLGLSTGFMLVRTVKLILITAFYIGRIDIPFLAPGVGVIRTVALDVYPTAFRKDLLVHDAHRHPYLERLCTMYMMKLRFGDGFAQRSGSCWRLLFVLVLMPWLRKYRVRLSFDRLAFEIADVEAQLGDENGDAGIWHTPSTRTLERANTVRKLENLRNLQSMRDFDNTRSREELLEQENKILRSKIALLEEQNEELTGIVR